MKYIYDVNIFLSTTIIEADKKIVDKLRKTS